MDTMRSLAMTLVIFFLLTGFTRSEDNKDPRAHPNLSPFEKWKSAYECVQNTSSNCSDKYQLKSVGWVNVTAEDGASYCKDGCSNHTMYQLKCLDDVMRGKYLFENRLTVKDINYTITKGCLSAIEEFAPENISMIMAEQDPEFCLNKGKAISNFAEAFEKDKWGVSSLLLPCASIGFFKSIASTVFGSVISTSLLGFWKYAQFPFLKCEEAHPDDNDTDQRCLNQHIEETEQKENVITSPCNEIPGMFKQFDIVDDYANHHFVNNAGKELTSQVRRGWLKKVQQEWSILMKDLPDSIYVRVYEERIDLLRACIVGAPGTPYHDGLFFFDIFFPPDYPREPPMVHYNSGGLRLNPNLYESGKVCLSLLNTWTGTGTEAWDPESSTILQVLLSLQALVLNDKPYFNEAGYDKQMGKAEGEKNSITYNENAFLLSCQSMLYLLRKPPKHFEELVEDHFARRSHNILLACKVYMDGAPVGFPLESGTATGVINQGGCSTGFKIMLAKLLPKLISGFTEKGIDCSQFVD